MDISGGGTGRFYSFWETFVESSSSGRLWAGGNGYQECERWCLVLTGLLRGQPQPPSTERAPRHYGKQPYPGHQTFDSSVLLAGVYPDRSTAIQSTSTSIFCCAPEQALHVRTWSHHINPEHPTRDQSVCSIGTLLLTESFQISSVPLIVDVPLL